jgi:hypothetical protein
MTRSEGEIDVADLSSQLMSLCAAVHARVVAADRERGDVPGWVLITLMTAGLVSVLWVVAGEQLKTMFTNALNSVTGPGAG